MNKDLEYNGFTKIKSGLTDIETKELAVESLNILNKNTAQDYTKTKINMANDLVENYQNQSNTINFFNQKTRNCVGVSEVLDKLLDRFLSNIELNKILNYYLKNPKLHGCTIRYADNNSDWLGIHSDSDSTISMGILLNKTKKTDTTTVFIRGSHLYKKPIKNKIERFNPSLFSYFLDFSTGDAGDVNIFFNRTAHGVKKQSKKYPDNSNNIILLGFHADSDKNHSTLLLPKITLYNKKTNLLGNNLLSFFETSPDNRKQRIASNKSDVRINHIYKYRSLKLNELLVYGYFKCFEFLLKSIRLIKKLAKI